MTDDATTEQADDEEATEEVGAEQADTAGEGEQGKPETFPRDYVERLRAENARYRQRAQDRDTLAAALWQARVAATGRLADPTDLALPADADPIDADTVAAAVDELLTRKPHLASRRPAGDIGQGATSGASDTVDLAGLLRARA